MGDRKEGWLSEKFPKCWSLDVHEAAAETSTPSQGGRNQIVLCCPEIWSIRRFRSCNFSS